jgi:hypothetical protein
MGMTSTAQQIAVGQPLNKHRSFFRAAQIYAERFSDADGRIRASFPVVHLSGWAPHEKPAKAPEARLRQRSGWPTP